MALRTELQAKLTEILGSPNVYFQPPSGTKLRYPCIIYRLNRQDILHADNQPYRVKNQYAITIIDANPDSPIPYRVIKLPTCSYSNSFSSDGLNHWIYTIYF